MTVPGSAVAMTGPEMIQLAKHHTLFEWSAQGAIDPIPVAGARGSYFWTPEGKRYLDFNSQLMCMNVGHGHRGVIEAMKRQLDLLPYVTPFMATEPRARLGAKLAELTPGDIDVFFFTSGGADANENAIRIARAVTGRRKILARYRSYHGATAGAITLTGDPRRWNSEPGIPSVVHVPDPYHGIQRGWDTPTDALAQLEEVVQLEGPDTIAAFIIEPIPGGGGVLIPPDGYLQGVREICDRHGILLIADEIMSGFGRTGKWFAVDHWGIEPDMMTMAKGLTSAYVQLGAVGMRRSIAEAFESEVYHGGLTYNSHPLACAAALATIAVYEDEDLVRRSAEMGELLRVKHAELKDRHEVVGEARSIGLFGAIELVADRASMEPLAPFNGTSPAMMRLAQDFRELGLYTFVRWNFFHTNPPLTVTKDELSEGFSLIDQALGRLGSAA